MKFESAFAKFKKGGLVLYRRGWEDCGYFRIVVDPKTRERKIYCYELTSDERPLSKNFAFSLISSDWFWSDVWEVCDEEEFNVWLKKCRKEFKEKYRKWRKKND